MTSITGRAPELQTARLTLRRWRESDRLPFAELNQDPRVMRFLGGPHSREKSDARIDQFEAEFEQRGFGRWAVETIADREFIGMVGLHHVEDDVPVGSAVEVAWRLAFRKWGQGFATEAGLAALGYGFNVAGLEEIVAFAAADNQRSLRVMDRIGMHHDAACDFDHPRRPVGDPLRRHALYRIRRSVAPS